MSLTGRGIFVPRRLSPPLAVRGLDYILAIGACRRPLPFSLYTFTFFNRDRSRSTRISGTQFPVGSIGVSEPLDLLAGYSPMTTTRTGNKDFPYRRDHRVVVGCWE